MVVQIDSCRFTPAAIPLEDEPPLLDADRMEAFKIAAQLFEVITGILICRLWRKADLRFLCREGQIVTRFGHSAWAPDNVGLYGM